jgi:hypothetical protein
MEAAKAQNWAVEPHEKNISDTLILLTFSLASVTFRHIISLMREVASSTILQQY